MPKTQSKKNKSSSQQNNKQHKDKKPYAAPSKNKISRAGQKTRDVKLRESLDDGLMPHLQSAQMKAPDKASQEKKGSSAADLSTTLDALL